MYQYVHHHITYHKYKFQYMNLLNKLTIELINQPSTNLQKNYCHNIIINFLEKLNFTIELINFKDTINIWAYQGEKKYNKTLLFLGHTDVVDPGDINKWKYPPFAGCVCDHVLYGRGTSDMKGALAAMLIAIKNFLEKYPNYLGRIAVIITSDEEGSGINGTKKVIETLIQRNEKIEYCIVGEPSSTLKIGDVIKNGRRGSLTATLKIYGTQGHVAYPQFLKNPIHLTLPMLSTLVNTKWDQKSSKFFPSTTIQITNINTNNNNNNITPDHITIHCNFRFNDQSSIYNIQQKIHEILKYYKLIYHTDFILSAEPYLSKTGTLTKIVIRTIENYQKIQPHIETTGGTSDGRFVAKMGTEIIELGALCSTIHKVNECIHLTDLKLLNIIYQKILENLFLPA